MNQTTGHKNNQRKISRYITKLKRGTKHENILRDRLKKEGLWFKHNTYYYDDKTLYFPDFILRKKYCKLIVEVDGKSHNTRKEYDEIRTKWLLENRNCEVIRFTNEDIENSLDMVIEVIKKHKPKTVNECMTERYCNSLNNRSISVDINGLYVL